MLERLQPQGFQIEYRSHAEAVLRLDFPEAAADLHAALRDLRIPIEDLVRGGGGEAKVTQSLRKKLAGHGWRKHVFQIRKTIDKRERESISHQVDHVRELPLGTIALEIEWNNKDPFFDRDLETFKRLHADGAISIGVVVTRGAGLQNALKSLIRQFAETRRIASFTDLEPYGVEPTTRQKTAVVARIKSATEFAAAWSEAFCNDKFGPSTTHWQKLQERVGRGAGNPCPLVLIGMPESAVVV